MDGLKTILFLSVILAILGGIMAHREMTKPKKEVKVEYKFINTNF